MNPWSLLVEVLLRSATLVLVIGAYVLVLASSTSTDALSAGLLAFALVFAIAFLWALVDGARRGFARPSISWLLTSVVAGAGIPAVASMTMPDRDPVGAVAAETVFYALLVLVPAAIGLGLGALVHRLRSRTAAAEPATVSAG